MIAAVQKTAVHNQISSCSSCMRSETAALLPAAAVILCIVWPTTEVFISERSQCSRVTISSVGVDISAGARWRGGVDVAMLHGVHVSNTRRPL
jgi:hypothetical protein